MLTFKNKKIQTRKTILARYVTMQTVSPEQVVIHLNEKAFMVFYRIESIFHVKEGFPLTHFSGQLQFATCAYCRLLPQVISCSHCKPSTSSPHCGCLHNVFNVVQLQFKLNGMWLNWNGGKCLSAEASGRCNDVLLDQTTTRWFRSFFFSIFSSRINRCNCVEHMSQPQTSFRSTKTPLKS